MSLDVFNVCASGMYAQKVKMDVTASNMANINTTRKEDGSPGVYVKKGVSFESVYNDVKRDDFPVSNHKIRGNKSEGSVVLTGSVSFGDINEISQGVEVAKIEDSKNPYRVIFDPSHPDADADGFVKVPNINVVEEMVNMVTASKAYEANATIAETTKNMISTALKI